MKIRLATTAMLCSAFLGGCATSGGSAPLAKEEPSKVQQPVQQASLPQERVEANVEKKKPRPDLIKITGIGYGSESTYEAYTPGQRRLMAIRASKLDAYRSLAEQLDGIKIDSNTAVATLTTQSDSFRARVNAVVRGARVVSITPMADHNYETVLEVYVDRSFFDNVFVYTAKQADELMSPSTPGGLCANGQCQ